MLSSILKKVPRQLVLMLVIALVLVAAYVSLGRQFMPAVSRYVSFFEEQILEISGVPVRVQSLEGDFEGFNPILHVNGMSLLVAADTANTTTNLTDTPLVLQKASMILDIPQSIWQRTWVLKDFVVESLELNLDQSESGAWELHGLTGGYVVDFDNLFRSLQRVSQLSLRNVVINLRTYDGELISFQNGLATIRNRNNRHYLHADLTLEGYAQQISLSVEVSGNELAEVDGQLYLDIPEADYSELFLRQSIADMTVQQLVGGGDFWFSFAEGKLSDFVAEFALSSVTFLSSVSEPLSLRDVTGKSSLRRLEQEDSWQLALSDMSLSWQQLDWSSFNAYMDFRPERNLNLRADHIDVSLIAQFAESSGLLSSNAQQQLEMYAPRGKLENFSLYVPLAEGSEELLRVRTNLSSVDVGSVRGSPNIWGLNGYVEADYSAAMGFASGFAEIESEEFQMNIPKVFTSIWDHNYVNGRLGFSLDLNAGMHLKLVSNVVVAETDIVDGRVQFTSTINRPDDGLPKAELELLVGALRFDAAAKAAYLPDGPQIAGGLANTVQWLDRAILDGAVTNSGVIFRSSILPNAPAASKTFQSFYLIEEGELNFSDEWPNLSDVTAYVLTDDSNIDIEVHSSNSLNVNANSVIGSIRKNANGENWLSIQGVADGATSDGLNYLHNTDVSDGLKSAFANWQALGNFTADIAVEVPLNDPQLETEVRLEIALENNSLVIPDYEIEVEELTGPVIFDTRTGVEATELSGQLFEQLANIKLSSELKDDELNVVFVDAAGLVTPEQLIAWPLQSQFGKDILVNIDGQFAYQVNLSMDQSGSSEAVNRLIIDSTLIGASLSLPHPFTKSVEMELPLHIDMEFAEGQQQILGTLGSTLSFDLSLEQGSVRDGLIFVGDSQSNFENLRDNNSEGLAILGNMDRFQLERWSDFLAEFNSDESVSEGMGDTISFVDLQIENFEFYGQQLHAVDMRIMPQLAEQVWKIELESESIAGEVRLPFDSADYLSLDLRYLRLPGEEADRMGPQLEQNTEQLLAEENPVDVLAGIDPRELPRMHFSTKEFRIGDQPYGNWSFTLSPNSNGAEIDDLAFDFRGLRLGLDTAIDPDSDSDLGKQLIPHFSWHYDGVDHVSALTGLLSADNMADVLTANGYAASLESSTAEFAADISWPGSPAFFAAANLSGDISFDIEEGRFLQGSGAAGALKLISILNFNAIMRRLRFSDDLLRSGLAYDEISGRLILDDGQVSIDDRLVISGPSSLYQITGDLNLKDETIVGEMYITLPVSQNIPWIGLLTANLPLAVGAYLLDRIFGNQVNSLTSAVYTLDGPWEGLEPQFKQAFGSPDAVPEPDATVQ